MGYDPFANTQLQLGMDEDLHLRDEAFNTLRQAILRG